MGPRQAAQRRPSVPVRCQHRAIDPKEFVACDLCGGQFDSASTLPPAAGSFGECTPRRYSTRSQPRACGGIMPQNCESYSPIEEVAAII